MIVVDMRYVDNSSVDSKQQHELRGVAWIGDWQKMSFDVYEDGWTRVSWTGDRWI